MPTPGAPISTILVIRSGRSVAICSAIRPPSVAGGTARLRLSVNTNLSEVTLDRFVAALAAAMEAPAVCSAVCS